MLREKIRRITTFHYDQAFPHVELPGRPRKTGAAIALVDKGNPRRKRTEYVHDDRFLSVGVKASGIVLEEKVLDRNPRGRAREDRGIVHRQNGNLNQNGIGGIGIPRVIDLDNEGIRTRKVGIRSVLKNVRLASVSGYHRLSMKRSGRKNPSQLTENSILIGGGNVWIGPIRKVRILIDLNRNGITLTDLGWIIRGDDFKEKSLTALFSRLIGRLDDNQARARLLVIRPGRGPRKDQGRWIKTKPNRKIQASD